MIELLKDNLREIKDDTVYSKQTVYAFELFGETGKGGRAENQDSFWFGDTSYGLLLVVCDGMGGGPGGRTASTLAVQEIGNYINHHPNLKPRDVVIGSILAANRAIYTLAKQHLELMGMGSTCVVVLLTEEKAVVCHVGDSRLYQLRGHKELFHTSDHSQVYEMVKNGIMNEEEARLSPISNVITKALGLSLDLKIEIKTDTSSDIIELPYQKGDRFVLCTDGIHGVLTNSVLIKELSASGDVENIVNDLYSKIHQLGVNSGNQHDNLTLLIAVAKNNSSMPETQRPHKFIPLKRRNNNWWKYLKYLYLIIPLTIMTIIVWYCTTKKEKVENNPKVEIYKKGAEDSISINDIKVENALRKDKSQKDRGKLSGDDTDYESFVTKGREAINEKAKQHSGSGTNKEIIDKKKDKNKENNSNTGTGKVEKQTSKKEAPSSPQDNRRKKSNNTQLNF